MKIGKNKEKNANIHDKLIDKFKNISCPIKKYKTNNTKKPT